MGKRAGADGAAADATPTELWVGRARAGGALLGFAVVFWVCHRAGFGVVDATLRGLAGAIALSLISWWSALLALQGLMRAAAAQRQRDGEIAAAEAAAARQAADEAFRTRRETVAADPAEAA